MKRFIVSSALLLIIALLFVVGVFIYIQAL